MFNARAIRDVVVSEAMVAICVFLLPTTFMGAVFTHLVERGLTQGFPVGRALTFNTLGAALAPAVFGVLALPHLGSRLTALLTVSTYLVVLGNPLRHWRIAGTALILAFPILWVNDRAWHGSDVSLIDYREGVTASVAVLEGPDAHRTLRINKRFQQGGTAAANAEYRHAHMPLLLHSNPRSALFLGLGTGITLGAATKHSDLRIDGVELVPEVLQVMPYFAPYNFSVWTNPAVALTVADARRFVRVAAKRYDVIVADLFHPAMDGAGLLYTHEHFSSIRSRLAEHGLFCQWLPLYQLDLALVRIIARTFTEVFPHSEAWLLRFNIDTPVLGLIGFLESPPASTNAIESRLHSDRLRQQMTQLSLADSIRFFGNRLFDAESLARFCNGTLQNTDDRPIVMFEAPKVTLTQPYQTLLALLDVPRNEATEPRLAGFMEARDVYLRALVDEAEGREGKAIDGFVASARTSLDFTLGYARCLTVASLLARSNPIEARRLLERLVEAQPSQPLAKEMLMRLFRAN